MSNETQTAISVAVIIVSYHTGPSLFQAIGSVLRQSGDIELCVVDNGNPPDVVERLRALAASEPRLKFITGYGNIGFSRGCNTGARMAKSDNLLFLNPDSILPENAIERLRHYRRTLPQHSMIGARLVGEDGVDQRGCRRALLTPATALIGALHLGFLFPKLRLNFDREPVPATITLMPAISGAFMFISRSDFRDMGGFDEGYFMHVEDLDLCLQFTRAGGGIYYAPDIVVTHIGGTSAAPSAFVEKHKARGFRRYFRKNFRDQVPLPVIWLLDMAGWLRMRLKIASA